MIKSIVEKIIGEKKQNLINELVDSKKTTKEAKTSHKLDAFGYKFKRVQADILYLPSDNGFRYLLVAVDNFSGLTDAIPLRNRTAFAVRKALDKIFSNGILEKPKVLQVDDGSEFKEGLDEYLKKQGISLRRAGTNRHRQMAVVEARNKTFSSIILKVQLSKELESGKVNKKWVHLLPLIIKEINSNLKKPKPIKPTYKYKCLGDECNILDVNSLVRYKMDYPTDYKGKRLHGNFRSGDVKWSLKPTKIIKVLLLPDYPVRYVLEGVKTHTFSKGSLKLVKNRIKKVKKPKKKVIKKPKEKWVDKQVVIQRSKRERKQRDLGFFVKS